MKCLRLLFVLAKVATILFFLFFSPFGLLINQDIYLFDLITGHLPSKGHSVNAIQNVKKNKKNNEKRFLSKLKPFCVRL